MTDALDIIASHLQGGDFCEVLVPVARERRETFRLRSVDILGAQLRSLKPLIDPAMMTEAIEVSCANELRNCGSYYDTFPWIDSLLGISRVARHVQDVPLTRDAPTQREFASLLRCMAEAGLQGLLVGGPKMWASFQELLESFSNLEIEADVKSRVSLCYASSSFVPHEPPLCPQLDEVTEMVGRLHERAWEEHCTSWMSQRGSLAGCNTQDFCDHPEIASCTKRSQLLQRLRKSMATRPRISPPLDVSQVGILSSSPFHLPC